MENTFFISQSQMEEDVRQLIESGIIKNGAKLRLTGHRIFRIVEDSRSEIGLMAVSELLYNTIHDMENRIGLNYLFMHGQRFSVC